MACFDMEYMGAMGMPKNEAGERETRVSFELGANHSAVASHSHIEPRSTILFSIPGFRLR